MTNKNKTRTAKPKGLAKYRSLIILATSFFGLVTVLSGVTYFTSQKIADATKELELASQQTVLVQQLSKNLLDLNLYLTDIEKAAKASAQATTAPSATAVQSAVPAIATPAQTTTPHNHDHTEHAHSTDETTGYALDLLPQVGLYQLQELGGQTHNFAAVLNALKNGGTVKDAKGNDVVIEAVTDPELVKILADIESIWTPFFGLLENFVNDTRQGVIKKETSDYLVDYVRLYNLSLQSETLDFSSRQNQLIQFSANQLRLGQIAGITVAFFLFLAIVFGSLRQLVRSDDRLAVAQQQTDDIMNTVNEGLFLINKDLVISDKYSGKLEEILHKQDIAGKTLYDILDGMISQKDMDTTKLFVEQLYNTWVVEELIQDLNPLKQVLLTYIDEYGVSATKFLEFNFLRVLDNTGENVESVFVSVTDITTEVNLQAQLQKDKEQHNRQIEMISYLLSVDGTQLAYFMKETKARIGRMNDVLKHRDTGNLKEKAEQLYREMHSLKGDASAVHLSALVDIAVKQEEKLKQLSQQTILKGSDFLPFTVGLDEMVNMVSFIDNLLQRLNLQGVITAPEADPKPTPKPTQNESDHQSADRDFLSEIEFDIAALNKGYWQNYYKQYAHAIAKRQGKEIDIVVDGFDTIKVNDGTMSAYKDIAVQLLKNAIVHGIEVPSVRTAHNKLPAGVITLSLHDLDNAQKLIIKDDGAGINWEKIRQKAVEIGRYSEAEAEVLTPRELLRLMFVSGVSTADKTDEDAGRGVGMDIVSQLASDHRAKISVNSRPNEFTEIGITFPKA